MTVKARTKNIGISAKKIRPLVNLLRGKKAVDAINILSFMPSNSSEVLLELIKSAIANAEHNNGADIDDLKVKTIFVDEGVTAKRFRARAKGRASGIKKPYSNLTIILSENINKKEEAHGTKS